MKSRQSKAFGKNIEREAEKRAIETARYVIPVACHTAMVYTVSGIVLHRLRRMARVGDVPDEAARVVGLMVEQVEDLDPDFFQRVGDEPLADESVVERSLAPKSRGATTSAGPDSHPGSVFPSGAIPGAKFDAGNPWKGKPACFVLRAV